MKKINKEDVQTIPVAFPAIAKQNEIIGRFSILISETEQLESLYRRKLAALDELKQALLHRAFNGEL